MDVLGRSEAVATLVRDARNVRAGGGAIRSISAGPGMGKTTLLAAARTRLASEPTPSLVSCAFSNSGPPLVQLRASLETAGFEPPRERTTGAVVEFLEGRVKRAPLALLLDDVQWADEASIEVIGELAQRATRLPLALTIAFRTRDRNETPGFRGLLRNIDRNPAHTRLNLSKLSDREARAVALRAAGGVLEPELLNDVVARADGNPLFVQELARAAKQGNRLARTLRTAVRAQLRGFSRAERSLLATAALLDTHCEIALLAAVAHLSGQRCLRMLETAIARDIVRLDGQAIEFTHPLVREVILDTIMAEEREQLHRQAFEVLESRSDDESIIACAGHAWEARDSRAYAYSLQAAECVASLAPARALTFYERALNDPAMDPASAVALCVAAVSCAGRIGDYERQRHLGERLLKESQRAGDPEKTAILTIDVTRLQTNRDGPRSTVESLERLRAASAPFPRAFAHLLCALMQAKSIAGDLEGARVVRNELSPSLQRLLEPRHAWPPNLYDLISFATGGQTPMFRDAVARAHVENAEYFAGPDRWYPLSSIALEFLNLGEMEDALEYARAAHGAADGSGARDMTGALLSRILRLMGNLDEAAALVDGALAKRGSLSDAPAAAIHAAAWRNDTLTIARYLDPATLAHVERSGDASNFATFAAAHMQAYAAWGDAGRARAIAAQLVAAVNDAHGCAEGLYLAGHYGSEATAREALRLLRAAAARGSHRLERAFGALLEADLAARSRSNEAAREFAREAIAACREVALPYYAALARAAGGEGDRETAARGTLTERERVVAELLAGGFENAEIAKVMRIGLETVRTHVAAVLAKLQVASRRDVSAALRLVPRSAK